MVSEKTAQLVDAEFGHHHEKFKLAPTATALAFPGVSPSLVSAIEADVVAAGGKTGAINFGSLFAALWPVILQYGAPMVMAILNAIIGMISGGGTPPIVNPPSPTGPVIKQSP